ncbi:MAG TPA: PfkB family carbohydrate kinase [Verrucomicrobiae bacterium]|nr:PfkB family carbohydrate kinase [Verrucomicrobiae bacterium]
MIIKADRIPKAGETILGGEFSSVPGGKGANQAVAAARAGGAVTFIARIGQDIFGKKAVAGLAAEGINVRQIIRDNKNPSGVALIFVGKSGENSIAVASGANACMTRSTRWPSSQVANRQNREGRRSLRADRFARRRPKRPRRARSLSSLHPPRR